MSNNELIGFNFKGSNIYGEMTAEEVEKELNKGKGFDPGTYDVEVTNVEYHKNAVSGSIYSDKDPTWVNAKITLSNGAQSKTVFLLVPTQKITFNETNSKAPTYVFQLFRQFMNGIGETVESNAAGLQAVVPKYFGNLARTPLKGKMMRVVIGFNGNYVKRENDSEFKICDRDGKQIVDSIFTSAEEALMYASEKDIRLVKNKDGKFYPEILSYIPKKVEDISPVVAKLAEDF